METSHAVITKLCNYIFLVKIITQLCFGEIVLETVFWVIVFNFDFIFIFQGQTRYFPYLGNGWSDSRETNVYWMNQVTSIGALTHDLTLDFWNSNFEKAVLLEMLGWLL